MIATFELTPIPGFANPANDTRAACAGAPNPEAWFPDPTDDYSAAAAECVACPIVASCGDWAMVHKQSGLKGRCAPGAGQTGGCASAVETAATPGRGCRRRSLSNAGCRSRSMVCSQRHNRRPCPFRGPAPNHPEPVWVVGCG